MDDSPSPLRSYTAAEAGRLTRSLTFTRTGITDLDVLLGGDDGSGEGGFPHGYLNMIAGAAHHGKTALAIATAIENHDRRIVFVTLDERADALISKLLAAASNMRTKAVSETSEEWRTERLAAVFPHLHLVVEDPAARETPNLEHVQAEISRLSAAHWDGEPADIVILDYVELFAPIETTDSMLVNVTEIIQTAKRMARSMPDTCFLLLHQMNRRVQNKPEGPDLGDLNYAGEKETDGVIVSAHRIRVEESKREITDEQGEVVELLPSVYMRLAIQKNKVTGATSPDSGVRVKIHESGLLTNWYERNPHRERVRTGRLRERATWGEGVVHPAHPRMAEPRPGADVRAEPAGPAVVPGVFDDVPTGLPTDD